jgi:hypothetical protein
MSETPETDNNSDQQDDTFLPEPQRLVREQIRKIYHHNRTDVPAEMAHKARSAFNIGSDQVFNAQIQDAPVSLLVYPQNPFISEPEVREMQSEYAKPNLLNARVRIRDSQHDIAVPDADNNYLYWTDTPQFNQVNAFYYVTLTLRMYEKFAHRKIEWAFKTRRVQVDPHAGTGLNAFYDEDSRTIGFFTFEQADGTRINTAQSADVVSHEAGHAVLDGLRDLYNQSFGPGPIAFHESFGDMSAVLVALHDDELVRQLLDWTEGDLSINNFISAVAEQIIVQMERASADIAEIDERTVYLRNAVNRFRAVPFADLPYFPEDPRYQLGRESHNYSRLFTGAFYDALVNVYNQLREKTEAAPRIAIHRTRDIMGNLLTCAVECGPVGELTFSDMALAFLTADMLLYDGLYADALTDAFVGRRLLMPEDVQAHFAELAALPLLTLPVYVIDADDAEIFLDEQVVPALGLPSDVVFTPLSAERDSRGYAFLTYFTVRSITLEGEIYGKFEGVNVDAFGGLTLAFDPTGTLRSALYRPVTDEDVANIRLMTTDLIAHGLVTETTFAGKSRVLSDEIVTVEAPSVQPRFLYMADQIATLGQRAARLVRDPMILDSVPHQTERFVDYLKNWRSRETPED